MAPEKQRGIPSPVLATSRRRESGSIHNPQRFVVLVVFCWDYGSADFNGLRLDNDFTRLLQNTNRKSQLNATIGVLLR